MFRNTYSCWLLGGGLSALLVWAALTGPIEQTFQSFSSLREGLLGGAHTDRNRRFRLQPYEIVPLLLSFVVAALANACGVGGGAFFVPMFNVLLGFSLKGSTALSQAVVTGGACAGFMYSSCKRHPDDHEQSLVDFDLALILTPMLLLGITAGVLINAVMPNWLITLLLVAVLTWLTFKTFMKGWQLHQSEIMTQHNEQNAQVAAEANRRASSPNVKPAAPEEVHQNGLHVEDVPTDTYSTVASMDTNRMVLASSTQLDAESDRLVPVHEDIEHDGSDKLNYQYAFVYGGLCAVASIFGVAIISTSVRRSGKGSRIVFTLALIIATGALMQAVFGGAEAVHDIRTGHHISFQPLC
ncbi:hypothetical protein WJX77_009840 [Trebouxia sp. C0004]